EAAISAGSGSQGKGRFLRAFAASNPKAFPCRLVSWFDPPIWSIPCLNPQSHLEPC
ncbi:MAG: hypothetical protein RLZ45_2805, partial [Verrucomicrobiota bacterium]